MKLIRTEFKNVLSFGGDIVNVTEYTPSSFNMIYGDNGVGKTNFTKLIEIGLYFEYPESVADIKNWSAKEGYIKHTVESNGSVWEITSVFRNNLKSVTVVKDNEQLDWGNPSSVKAKIAEYIITVPFTVFKNILCSSIDNMSSVLKMNAKESRDITNQIFDLNEINLVGAYTSKYNYNKNRNLGETNEKLTTLRTSLESQEDLLKEHKAKNNSEKIKRKTELKAEIEEFEKSIKLVELDISKNKASLESISYHEDVEKRSKIIESIADLKKQISELSGKIEVNQTKLNKLDIEKANNDLSDLVDNIKLTESDIAIKKEEKTSIENTISKYNEKVDNVKKSKVYLDYIGYANKLTDTTSKIAENNILIDSLNKSIEARKANIQKHSEFEAYYASLKSTHDMLLNVEKTLKPVRNKLIDKLNENERLREAKVSEIDLMVSDLSEIDREIIFLQNPKCPLSDCGKDFSSPSMSARKDELYIKRNEIDTKLSVERNAYATLTKEHSKLLSEIADKNAEINMLIAKIKEFSVSDVYPYEGSLKDNFDLVGYRSKYSVNIDLPAEQKELNSDIDKRDHLISDNNNKNAENKLATNSMEFIRKEFSMSDEDFRAVMLPIYEEFKDVEVNKKEQEINSSILTGVISAIEELDKSLYKKSHDKSSLLDKIKSMDDNLKYYDGLIDLSYESISEDMSANKTKLDEYNTSLIEENNNLKHHELKISKDYDSDVEYETPSMPKDFYIDRNIGLTVDLNKDKDKLSRVKFELDALDAEDESEKFKLFEESINKIKNSVSETEVMYNKALLDFQASEILKELYNNGWLKNELIGKVVGGINKIVYDITEKYDINVRCEFDSGFNAKFYKNGLETKYGLCSVGQRKMMQLIAIIAIIAYYRQIYRDLNFIYLDEALSSLSEVNVNKMVSVIKEYLINEMGMVVFISHHSYLSNTYFDRCYELKDTKTYTEIAIIESNG